ncbi:FHA domain-containing protein [Roseospira visakhapatnamensis]|uniref:FHA domain-containing protein n=1 Tax=Roseospira visakhapatnamensis TaxID=390880 RepID=A0A7W6RGQ4_9PROT|nr:FHA domain-containing protein [Roseospira visakhapatnamensis]MBB4268255.1 hypothetical protein [Roseospira visakhapatnamensis]
MPLLLTLTSDLDLDDDQVMTQVVGPAGLTIGRGLDNDWIIKDPRRLLSKHHCRLDASGTAFIVTDTSTNGVFLNDSPTPLGRGNTALVGDGDRVRLGELDVVVQMIPEADAAALAGLSADPFASRTPGPSGPKLPAPGDDDPWGGWTPPGGRGDAADDDDGTGPPVRPLEPLRPEAHAPPDEHPDRSMTAGPMPPGDSLFGRTPGEAIGPWEDGTGEAWASAGADADDAAPEALAFLPAASPTPAIPGASGDDAGASAAGEPAGDGLIPEDWDDLAEGAAGEGQAAPVSPVMVDEGPPAAHDRAVDPLSAPRSGPIPEDFAPDLVPPLEAPSGDVPPPDDLQQGPQEDGPQGAPIPATEDLLAVVDDCLAVFAPAAIQDRLPSLGDPEAMPPAVRQARAWAAYETRYPDLAREARSRLAEALGLTPPEAG